MYYKKCLGKKSADLINEKSEHSIKRSSLKACPKIFQLMFCGTSKLHLATVEEINKSISNRPKLNSTLNYKYLYQSNAEARFEHKFLKDRGSN